MHKSNVSISHLGCDVECFRDFLKPERSKVSIPKYHLLLGDLFCYHLLRPHFAFTVNVRCLGVRAPH